MPLLRSADANCLRRHCCARLRISNTGGATDLLSATIRREAQPGLAIGFVGVGQVFRRHGRSRRPLGAPAGVEIPRCGQRGRNGCLVYTFIPDSRVRGMRHSGQGGDGRNFLDRPKLRISAQNTREGCKPSTWSPHMAEGSDCLRRQHYMNLRRTDTQGVSASLAAIVTHQREPRNVFATQTPPGNPKTAIATLARQSPILISAGAPQDLKPYNTPARTTPYPHGVEGRPDTRTERLTRPTEEKTSAILETMLAHCCCSTKRTRHRHLTRWRINRHEEHDPYKVTAVECPSSHWHSYSWWRSSPFITPLRTPNMLMPRIRHL